MINEVTVAEMRQTENTVSNHTFIWHLLALLQRRGTRDLANSRSSVKIIRYDQRLGMSLLLQRASEINTHYNQTVVGYGALSQ
jgi:hypothetical protein